MGDPASGKSGVPMAFLLRTDRSLAGLVMRLALAVAMFPHGAQKALGLFGGGGVSGTVSHFQQNLGISPAMTYLVIAAEFLGSIGLALGLLTRVAALGIAAVMGGAVYYAHAQNGFFMNWHNVPQQGEGYEYHLLAIGLALALVIRGGGCLSLDGKLAKG